VLGALYNTHHGLTNAVVLPYGVARNARYLEARLPALCRALDIEGEDAPAMVERLLQFRAELKIPATLRELDIDDADVEDIGKRALVDPCTASNAGPMTAEDFTQLFQDAVSGNINLQYGSSS
jgi:alcohol dehydrogenase class IV